MVVENFDFCVRPFLVELQNNIHRIGYAVKSLIRGQFGSKIKWSHSVPYWEIDSLRGYKYIITSTRKFWVILLCPWYRGT